MEGWEGTGEVRNYMKKKVCFTAVADPGETCFAGDRTLEPPVETGRRRKGFFDISEISETQKTGEQIFSKDSHSIVPLIHNKNLV